MNNNNKAICCTFNILVHRKRTATLGFQISTCDTNFFKKMGKRKNTSQRNSISKKGKQGESVAAEMPEGKTLQHALTM